MLFSIALIINFMLGAIDASLAGTIIASSVTAIIGTLAWRVNKKKTDDDSETNEINRIRTALKDRDQLYRDLVSEIHILNAWVFLLTAQLREQNITPAEKPVPESE